MKTKSFLDHLRSIRKPTLPPPRPHASKQDALDRQDRKFTRQDLQAFRDYCSRSGYHFD